MPFPFKDKELNKIAAFFNLGTFLLTCAAIVQSSWFRIKGLHCTQRLSLAQFFSFVDDNDDNDDQLNMNKNMYVPRSMSDFNGELSFRKRLDLWLNNPYFFIRSWFSIAIFMRILDV